jgi:predicted nucleic acid-binding protein
MWKLRNNFSASDAAYVVLAEALDAELLTADDRLAKSVRAHTLVRLAGIDWQ